MVQVSSVLRKHKMNYAGCSYLKALIVNCQSHFLSISVSFSFSRQQTILKWSIMMLIEIWHFHVSFAYGSMVS